MRTAPASLAAAVLLAVASGCAGEPLAPLPVQTTGPPAAAPGPSAAAARSPGTTTAAGTAPATRATGRPARPVTPAAVPSDETACRGAVRYEIDLQQTVLDLITSLCFRAGGVLRLRGIGPGLVTATPADLVAQSYEAGVVDLRFLRPGTVTVRIPQEDRDHTIEVVVIE
jgi:hypothetical protein